MRFLCAFAPSLRVNVEEPFGVKKSQISSAMIRFYSRQSTRPNNQSTELNLTSYWFFFFNFNYLLLTIPLWGGREVYTRSRSLWSRAFIWLYEASRDHNACFMGPFSFLICFDKIAMLERYRHWLADPAQDRDNDTSLGRLLVGPVGHPLHEDSRSCLVRAALSHPPRPPLHRNPGW